MEWEEVVEGEEGLRVWRCDDENLGRLEYEAVGEDGSEAHLVWLVDVEAPDTEVPVEVIELKLAELEQAEREDALEEDGELGPELNGEVSVLSRLVRFSLR